MGNAINREFNLKQLTYNDILYMTMYSNKIRLVVFLVLNVSGLLMLVSKYPGNIIIEVKHSIQYCKSAFDEGIKQVKDTDNIVGITVKIHIANIVVNIFSNINSVTPRNTLIMRVKSIKAL